MKFQVTAKCNSGETWSCIEEAENEDALIDKIGNLDHPVWRTAPDGPALADPNGTAWVDSVRNNGWSLSRLFGLNDMDDCSERVDLTWKVCP